MKTKTKTKTQLPEIVNAVDFLNSKPSYADVTEQDIIDEFEAYAETEFLHFERVENPRSGRPDVHAFILLDKLCPGLEGMIVAGEPDRVVLGVEVSDLLRAEISGDEICELVRCGVRYKDVLCLFY